MLPDRLYSYLNAADAYKYFERAGEERPYPHVTRDALYRVLAHQADKLFVLQAYASLDTAGIIPVSVTMSASADELCLYDRSGARDPQTNRPVETGRFIVSDQPSPEVIAHGDIVFWLDRR